MASENGIKDKERPDMPKVHFVRGGVYVKSKDLLQSKVGQKHIREVRELQKRLETKGQEIKK